MEWIEALVEVIGNFDAQPYVGRTFEGSSRGWYHRWRGRCYRVPAEYLDSVYVHIVHGRLRIYGVRLLSWIRSCIRWDCMESRSSL